MTAAETRVLTWTRSPATHGLTVGLADTLRYASDANTQGSGGDWVVGSTFEEFSTLVREMPTGFKLGIK